MTKRVTEKPRKPKHGRFFTTSPYLFRPLPMNDAFWRDLEILRLRAKQFAAYAPRQQRDMDKGWA